MSYGARTLLALLLVLFAAAPAAAAPVTPDYKMIYVGSGSYAVDLVSPEGSRGHVAAAFDWRVVYRAVPVHHGIINWQRGNATGSGEWSMSSEADSCSRTGPLELKGDGGGLVDFQGRLLEVIVFPEEGDYSSTDLAGPGGPCDTADFWSQWITGFSQIGVADQVDPLTSYFKVPKAKLKQKRGITLQTSNQTPMFPSLIPASSCGFSEIGQCTQDFSWHARVVIKRVR